MRNDNYLNKSFTDPEREFNEMNAEAGERYNRSLDIGPYDTPRPYNPATVYLIPKDGQLVEATREEWQKAYPNCHVPQFVSSEEWEASLLK